MRMPSLTSTLDHSGAFGSLLAISNLTEAPSSRVGYALESKSIG